ncbi:MAG: response regulator [Spirochaetaceae bacterium]|nr:response regulator [Spirochaetaceae bacterium]
MIKTLIVDDSSLVRNIIRDFLERDGSFEIIGEAENGLEGVSKAQLLAPDLITMDIEMPLMNGLDAIDEIKKVLSTAIVVISSHDTAKMAYDATVRGAFEFYSKDMFLSRMTDQQRERTIGTLKQISGIKKRIPVQKKDVYKERIEMRQINAVVIAASTGGPNALNKIFSAIPKEFPVPIILVQHNISGFDLSFVQWLNGCTPLQVILARENTIPVKGNIYVAPTDRHLVIGEVGLAFNDSGPINNQKPAADMLFKSAAELYGKSLISVVLTGMGSDGAEGTRYVKNAGGITLSQDEASSMIYGMPQSAIDTGCVDMVLSVEMVAPRLIFLANENGKI